MIEVTLMLHDSGELTHVHALVQKLEDRRKAWAENQRTKWDKAPEQEITGGERAREVNLDAPTVERIKQEIDAEQRVVAEVGPETTSVGILPGIKPVSPADMETALRAFIEKYGLGDARALLTEFGIDRIGAVAPERRAELAARLSA